MFKEFIQNFVIYHGCGAWYYDGTNKILNKNRRCILPTYKPFWKKPNNVRNKVETRAQLKLKSIVTNDYIRRYFKSINAFDKIKDILVQMMNLQTTNQSKLILTNQTLNNLILEKNSSLKKILF